MVELECFAYGVGHADEGICLLVRMGPYRILLDCGLRDMTPLLSEAASQAPADLVLCTHAHPDHARGLLALHHAFPKLPIYASEVTTELLSLNWPTADAETVSPLCQALPWRSPVEFGDGLSAELWPAGHLPGAASILLTYTTPQRSYTLFYTGDFLLSSLRLVEGFPLEELRGLKPDVLIIEGSYGTARYPRRRQQENQLAERISRAIAHNCSVLLPTPALGLGQELLMLLRSHHHFTGREVTIWVDGAVATGCDAYLDLLHHLPSTVQNFAQHQPLFWDERIRPRVRRLDRQDANPLSDLQGPCIILTDEAADLSQYCRADARDWLLLIPQRPHRLNTALEPGLAGHEVPLPLYQTPESLRHLQTQIRAGKLSIETYFLAEHSDGAGTTQLIHNLRPQHLIFVHGSPTYLSDLTSLDELHNRYHLHCPSTGTGMELPVGDTFLQPAAPETNYEGELTELGTIVTVTLPESITGDPRWQHFADTGLLEARWQGEELVLRGLTQWELLNQGTERSLAWQEGGLSLRQSCGNCRHYRGQRCWNEASPLSGFKVTPEGYCPVFEPRPQEPEEE